MEKTNDLEPSRLNRLRDLMIRVGKKELDLLLEQYRVWMLEKSTLGFDTINSYLTWIRGLRRGTFLDYQLEHSGEDFDLVELITDRRAEKREEVDAKIQLLDDLLTNLLEQAKKNPVPGAPSDKDYNNWRSSWRKLRDYRESEQATPVVAKSAESPLDKAVANFQNWLRESCEFGEGSVQRYGDRLKDIQENLFDSFGIHGAISTLQGIAAFDPEDAQALSADLIAMVKEKPKDESPVVLWDERITASSLVVIKRYQAFLRFVSEEYIWEDDLQKAIDALEVTPLMAHELEDMIQEANVTIIHSLSAEELYKTFSNRLRTQDRTKHLPIRQIIELFRQDGRNTFLSQYIDLWCAKSLNSMLVHTDSGTFRLSEVTELLFADDGRVYVDLYMQGSHQLLTYTKTGELVPMKAENLKQITIEHKPSIAKFLEDNQDKLAILPISKEDFIPKVAKLSLDGDRKKLTQFCLDLVKDLEFVAENVQLELMHSSENVNPGKSPSK